MRVVVQLVLVLLFFACANSSFAAPTESEINAQRTQVKNEIYKLKLLEKIETNKLYSNQQKLEKTEQNLSQTKLKLSEAKEEMTNLEGQLREALADYRELNSAVGRRIVQIYKIQRKNYLEFLMNAKDINNFLDRIYFENIVMNQDRERITKLQKRTKRIMDLKARIQVQRLKLADSAKSMDRQQKNIQVAIKKNQQLIHKLQTDRAAWEKAERELARDSERLASMINRTTTTTTPKASGVFVRPVYGGITSYYGWRTHPIFKKKKFHSGIDIGAPMGTPIKAANSGKVIFTGWYGGYGNVVIIDHGTINGKKTTTLYAHMSRIRTTKGANVTKGQTIGNVGSTGYSTGPHLHFEVRLNGATANPLNYIPG